MIATVRSPAPPICAKSATMRMSMPRFKALNKAALGEPLATWSWSAASDETNSMPELAWTVSIARPCFSK